MPREDGDAPAYLDEIHQDIAEFWERHADHLDDDFIDAMLESHGYERTTAWGPPAQQGRGGGSGGGQARRPGARRQQAPGGGGQRGRQGGGGGSYFRGAQQRG